MSHQPVSVDTSPLGTAASRYDSVSKSVHTVLNSYFTQVADALRTACGNDETGQKVYRSLTSIQHNVVKSARLLADVTALTGDGLRDMRDAYENAETNADLLARGVDSQQHLPTNPPGSNQNPGDNTPTPNTSSGNGRRH